MMELTYEGRGYKFYNVPVILKRTLLESPAGFASLQVRYDISKKEYKILGIGNEVENGRANQNVYSELRNGDIITPLFLTVGTPEDSQNLQSEVLFKYSYIKTDPKTQKTEVVDAFIPNRIKKFSVGDKSVLFKANPRESFVYSQNSKIIEKKISNGDYMGVFQFIAPNGSVTNSLPFTISIRHGEIDRDVIDELNLEDMNK